MLGLFYILLCLLAGNIIAYFTGNYISGNIIGMILLFCLLEFKVVDAEKVRPVAKFLLGSMALFFVPYGVGLMVSYEVIMKNLWAIIVASVVSTVLIMLTVGWIYQRMVHRR